MKTLKNRKRKKSQRVLKRVVLKRKKLVLLGQ